MPDHHLQYRVDGAGLLETMMTAWRRARGRKFLVRQFVLAMAFVVLALWAAFQIGPFLELFGIRLSPLFEIAVSIALLGLLYQAYYSINVMLVREACERMAGTGEPVQVEVGQESIVFRSPHSEHRLAWPAVRSVDEVRGGLAVSAGLIAFYIAPQAFTDAAHRAEVLGYCRSRIRRDVVADGRRLDVGGPIESPVLDR